MSIHLQVLLTVFITALILGAVVNKTNFCTMGAVSDWVNMGDKGRLRAWFFAIAVAMGGLAFMQASGIFAWPQEHAQVFPPYRTPLFAWLRYIIGGTIFGIGMTIGSGCANRTLVRIGGGNLKSVVVLIAIASTAYVMMFTDVFGLYVLPWATAGAIDLAASGIETQELGAIVNGVFNIALPSMNQILGAVIVVVLLWFIFKSRDFRGSFDNILGGLTVGAAVVMGWWITGGFKGQAWLEEAAFSDNPPARVAVQSFTFISPTGDSARLVLNPSHLEFVSFGVMALTGVIVGSFLYAILSKRFRIEWFRDKKDATYHVVGGVLMGFGGVLAMGCTIGQGVTGVSTLAVGSFLALISIIFGSALTMKIQFNMMSEQGFFQALRNGLAELRLLPAAK
ncbi:MAG: YeeE/YedE family protein [Acidiferrobacterales bacterium]